MKTIEEIGLLPDVESIKEVMNLMNELNVNLERAKKLIEELNEKEINLNITSNPISLDEYQKKILNKIT